MVQFPGYKVLDTKIKFLILSYLILWNLELLVFVAGGKPENPEKNPRGRERTNNKQSSTRITEVGGERLSTAPTMLHIRKPPSENDIWVFCHRLHCISAPNHNRS